LKVLWGSLMAESILVLGGARSGKTGLAERLASERPPVAYVATAVVDPADGEMAARVARHRAGRPAGWTTREVSRELAEVLAEIVGQEGSVVIDCVTLWVSNLMLGADGGPSLDDPEILARLEQAAAAAHGGNARVVWVSNEVGSGVVPESALGRRFADLQGWANQRLAAACDSVFLCVAGVPVQIK
jgi:adenosylcobinamide kinase/adenosylcobinamide-phosphate guanylyltransferase